MNSFGAGVGIPSGMPSRMPSATPSGMPSGTPSGFGPVGPPPQRIVTIPVLADRLGALGFEMYQVGTANVTAEFVAPGMVIYFPDARNPYRLQSHAGYRSPSAFVPNSNQSHGQHLNSQRSYASAVIGDPNTQSGGVHQLLVPGQPHQGIGREIPLFASPFGTPYLPPRVNGPPRPDRSLSSLLNETRARLHAMDIENAGAPVADANATASARSNQQEVRVQRGAEEEKSSSVTATSTQAGAGAREGSQETSRGNLNAGAVGPEVEGEVTARRSREEVAAQEQKSSDEGEFMLTMEFAEIERAVRTAPLRDSPSKTVSGWNLDVCISMSCEVGDAENYAITTPATVEKVDFNLVWSDTAKSSGAGDADAASSHACGLSSTPGSSRSLALNYSDAAREFEARAEQSDEQSRIVGEKPPPSDRYGCAICSESLECAASRRDGGIFIKIKMSSINLKEVVATPCGHLFHKYCLYYWFYVDTVNKYSAGEGLGILNLLPLFSSASAWACPICRVRIPGPKSLLKIFPSNVTSSETHEEEPETPGQDTRNKDQCPECSILNDTLIQIETLQAEVDAGWNLANILTDQIWMLRSDLVYSNLVGSRLDFQSQDARLANRQLNSENFQLRNLILSVLGMDSN